MRSQQLELVSKLIEILTVNMRVHFEGYTISSIRVIEPKSEFLSILCPIILAF